MTDRRVAVKVAYSGKDFSGSQVQPGLTTVMGEIARVLVLTGDGRDEGWFDLNGRRLSTEPTQSGIYIKEGRKILRR